MKLKSKIILIFISSIILSVIIFLVVIAYLMSNGWWSGVSNYDMEFVADSISVQIAQADSLYEEDSYKRMLDEWKYKYPGMELELFSDKMELICTTAREQQIQTIGELLESLSKHGQFSQDRWVSARELTTKNGVKYLVVLVPSKYYSAISYSVNMPKGAGIFGKMFLIGLGISLVISGVFAYIFTKGIIRRFNILYEKISSFDIENMKIKIVDTSNDEIGYLALMFNRMSERLKNQVDDEKAYQNERKKLVANISHDLRTPLASIVGYSETLASGIYENEDEKKKYIDIIKKKALYMDQLLSELLDYSRLESGGYILKKSKIDITELVREILIEY
ncbi:MAG: HAMP domain-containing histidine kinase, partial [Clostridiaceae bacterium]|nr:HAMP domain-containing histidine kinase [Clostridiaceae bacterium]